MFKASDVKELREKTGAGMLDCKKALTETNGNMEEAVTWLREKGISKAAKKADRIAAEGIASILVDGNNAVIVEVNSETDFVAKNEEGVGVITGYGMIEGSVVYAFSQDVTVMGGAVCRLHAEKIAKMKIK